VPALTSSALSQHLWATAQILRGTMESSKYKGYLLCIFVIKRLSDRFEEEAEALVAGGVEETVAWTDPDEHQFMVPERARWSAITAHGANLGEALNVACATLADANAALAPLLGIDFNDQHSFGNSWQRDRILRDLLNSFSALSLRNSDLEAPNELGFVYEALVEHFARDEGKRSSTVFTPRPIIDLIVRLLDPQCGMRICDPACGTGGMLARCAAYVAERQGRRLGADSIDLTLHGQEINAEQWALCKMNMFMLGLPDVRVERGDTLRDPKLVESGELIVYDRVLTNPPFSLSNWGGEWAAHDPLQRFRYGLPPRHMGDYAFVQHVLATLNPAGVAGVVVSHGALFRGVVEKAIRARMVDDDVIEAIIGLPANLFYGASIPVAILLLNRNKPRMRKNKILFVDASSGFETRAHQNILRPVDVARIVAAVQRYADEERFCHVATLAEVAANDHNLSISRYVDTFEADAPSDIGAALATLREFEAVRDAAAARMDELLRDLGYDR
jgi:type I restriction enzyme M protein